MKFSPQPEYRSGLRCFGRESRVKPENFGQCNFQVNKAMYSAISLTENGRERLTGAPGQTGMSVVAQKLPPNVF
jgi:hypothetical protein